MSLQTTSSQTVGPFFHIGLTWLFTDNLVAAGVAGDPVVLEGAITDGDGQPVIDAVVEIWQANSHGRYNHPEDRRNLPLDAGFEGYGRASTFTDGSSTFTTVKPGRVPWPAGGMQAPHINVSIFARGLLNRVATRMYFDGDPANAEDPVLKMVDPARRPTLLAKKDGKGTWRLPIHLGGPTETVFFDI